MTRSRSSSSSSSSSKHENERRRLLPDLVTKLPSLWRHMQREGSDSDSDSEYGTESTGSHSKQQSQGQHQSISTSTIITSQPRLESFPDFATAHRNYLSIGIQTDVERPPGNHKDGLEDFWAIVKACFGYPGL